MKKIKTIIEKVTKLLSFWQIEKSLFSFSKSLVNAFGQQNYVHKTHSLFKNCETIAGRELFSAKARFLSEIPFSTQFYNIIHNFMVSSTLSNNLLHDLNLTKKKYQKN